MVVVSGWVLLSPSPIRVGWQGKQKAWSFSPEVPCRIPFLSQEGGVRLSGRPVLAGFKEPWDAAVGLRSRANPRGKVKYVLFLTGDPYV
ncbi:MAG: hypothetical protein CVU52_07550 [Deltaproteobacteria bacterium HGW-Deltaproteobacteria-10]|nr:MAG: hypothetical protein CVU52_07550 [Deltaproteobacteria bacterium HGW-Deltaproteobacteria-10]